MAERTLRDRYPCHLAGVPVESDDWLEVDDKYLHHRATRVARASRAMIDQAIAAAVAGARSLRGWAAWRRAEVLRQVAARIAEREDEFATVLVVETGKPINLARAEVLRAIDTLSIAAEEATRIHGEQLPLDVSPRGDGLHGIVRRFPIGPCSFITPFNFPLNLAAHKIAPAIAAGCSFVLKPASSAPVSALLLAELLAETELPKGAFSVLPCASADAQALIEDERMRYLSFTGAAELGWALAARAGKKRVTLELGGNAACIVDAGTDVAQAAERLMFGAFYQAGQSCISVQRVFAHRSLYTALRDALVERARAAKRGDPLDEETFVGPLISIDDAVRVEEQIRAAVARGARIAVGGTRDGAIVDPTVLEDVPEDAEVSCQEIFGPVVTLAAFDDFGEALRRVNASRFGLQAGVFTNDFAHAWQAFDELEVGGVVIGDVPSTRVDAMPYGGVKDSGLGREGMRYAIAEMTEPRLMLIRQH